MITAAGCHHRIVLQDGQPQGPQPNLVSQRRVHREQGREHELGERLHGNRFGVDAQTQAAGGAHLQEQVGLVPEHVSHVGVRCWRIASGRHHLLEPCNQSLFLFARFLLKQRGFNLTLEKEEYVIVFFLPTKTVHWKIRKNYCEFCDCPEICQKASQLRDSKSSTLQEQQWKKQHWF